jgi:hypothetical protein
MKTSITPLILLIALLMSAASFSQNTGNVGVGEHHPGSRLSVNDNLAIGSSYSALHAPENGAIIEGTVGIGTTTPDPKAILELQSSAAGILIPRMSTAQKTAISSPPNGLLVFDTDLNSFSYFNSKDASWAKMLTDAQGLVTGDASTQPGPIYSRGTVNVTGGATYTNVTAQKSTYLTFTEQDGNGAFNISGIAQGVDGQMIILENDYSNTGNMILEAGKCFTGNDGQIFIRSTHNTGNLTVQPGNTVALLYNGAKSRWETINWQH